MTAKISPQKKWKMKNHGKREGMKYHYFIWSGKDTQNFEQDVL